MGMVSAHDLNPTRIDLKARILTTNINLDEEVCSIKLGLSQAELFGINLADAKANIHLRPDMVTKTPDRQPSLPLYGRTATAARPVTVWRHL